MTGILLAGAVFLVGAVPLLSTGVPAVEMRACSAAQQVLAMVSGFLIKPSYMAIAGVLVWLLRGRREAELKALRLALACFFIGESFCYVNIFLFHHASRWCEYLHSYGMVLGIGLGSWTVLEGSGRFLRFPLGPLPGLGVASCLVMAALPLTVGLHPMEYQTRFGRFLYDCSYSAASQLYDLRVCPLLAVPLLAGALLTLGRPVSKALFCAGFGLLAFSLMRLLVSSPFRGDRVMFDFWEEATELLGLAAVALALRTFRPAVIGGSQA